jgi:hypothetical protein
MDETQRAAFLIAQAVCAMAEIAAMQAENQHRIAIGRTDLYGEDAFNAVPDRYGIHHNAALTLLHGGA